MKDGRLGENAQNEASIKASGLDLFCLMLTGTLAGASISLAMPLTSLVLQDHGFNAAQIGTSAAAHGLGILAGVPVFPYLIAKLKPTGAIILGLVVCASINLLLPLYVDLSFWFVARLLIGASTALIFIVSEAAIVVLADKVTRGRILGLYASFFSIGYAIGPILIPLLGTQGIMPFLAGSVLLYLGIIPAVRVTIINGLLKPESARFNPKSLVMTLKRAPLALVAIFCFGAIETAMFALFGSYAGPFEIRSEDVGWLLSFWAGGNIIFQYPVGWLADRFGPGRILCWAVSVTMICHLVLPLVLQGQDGLWLLMLIHGGFAGAIYTLSLNLLGNEFSSKEMANANTAFVLMLKAGIVIGPLLVGNAMILLGTSAFVSSVFLMFSLLLLFQFYLARMLRTA